MIQRHIHHIWIGGSDATGLNAACRESILELNPGWTVFYHRDLRELIEDDAFAPMRDRIVTAWGIFGKGNSRQSGAALQADILRLMALYKFGGIYCDHDLFGLRPFDRFLSDDLLFAQFQDSYPGEFLIGCAAGDDRVMKILDQFCNQDGSRGIITMELLRHCNENKWFSYPPEWFCPHPRHGRTQVYRTTQNTHAIHCWRQQRYDVERLRELQAKPLVLHA